MKIKMILISFLFASSCSLFQKVNQVDPCYDQRLPTSEKFKCSGIFSKDSLQNLITRSVDKSAGLSQAKFTSYDGRTVKEGTATPTQDPKQIVSFYTDLTTTGMRNRGGSMVQGTPTEIIFDKNQKPAYIIFGGQKVRLLEFTAYMDTFSTQVIKGQDYVQHPEGFGTPVGRLKGWEAGLSEYPIAELKAILQKYTVDGVTTLEYESGIVVKGVIEGYIENNSGNFGSAVVISFKKGTCKVTYGQRVLFDPSWGSYDMTLGTSITEINNRSDSFMYNPDRK